MQPINFSGSTNCSTQMEKKETEASPKKDEAKTMSMRSLVLGGSGQCGAVLVSTLLKLPKEQCEKVTVLSRRALPELEQKVWKDERVDVRVINNLDKLGEEKFEGYNSAFMMQGYGAPSQATKDDLLRVDATIPIAFAQACKAGGIKHFSVLSAVNADVKAKWSYVTKSAAAGGWYQHCKGVMEEGIKQVGFSSLFIARPAGIYPGTKNTPQLFGWFNEKLNGVLPGQFMTASAQHIATAMVVTMQKQLKGDNMQGVKIAHGGQAVRQAGAAA
eukprot:g38975.t1